MDLLPATLLQQKLEYYLNHPSLRVPEVRKEFEDVLKLKFPDMNASLRDDPNVRRQWRQELKKLEDEVDSIMIFNLSHKSPMLWLGHQLPFIFRLLHLHKQLMEVRRLGERIRNLQTEDGTPAALDNVCESTQAEEQSLTLLGSANYGVRPSTYDVTKGKNSAPIHAEVVSRIKDLLLNSKDKRFKVVGVIGRKGIGKSRLVTHVYQNDEVRKFFDCYAWISNPSSSEPESILREMLRQFYFGFPPYTLETMDKQTLLLAINKCLDRKRFLLVLDSVSDFGIWESVIFPAFPFGRQLAPLGPVVFTSSFIHGRIVFTSNSPHRRIFDILVNQVYVQIRLKALSQEEPWALFCQLMSQDTETPETWPPGLEGIAREIIKKSGGLPFVIRLLAGVLRGSRSPEVWQKRLTQLVGLEQYSRDDTVKAILLSYDALALPLKSCFLYFSIFPKDIEIPLERVIRLWVAEGLVVETSTPMRTATEASMAYLQELINRELIQPGHVDVKGDLKSCKFDDQVRRVAVDIIESNERYLVHTTDNGSSGTAGMPSLRFFSIQGKGIEDMKSGKNDAARIRSCIITGISKLQSSTMRQCLSGFQLLRVLDLDLEGSDIETLPNRLGTLVLLVYLKLKGSKLKELPSSALENLIRLRYLGLRRTGITELPASFLRLKDLHTLDVRETKLRTLPCCLLSRLQQLRHLYLCSSFRREVVEMPLGKETEQPLELQTLAGVRATSNLIEKQLGRCTQLRKLCIGRVAEADSEKFCASIDKMNYLRSLSIRCEINESLHMGSLAHSTTNVDTLRIGGSVEALDSAIKCFRSLRRLFLWDNLLRYDPLPILQDLPNLMVLCLSNTFLGKELRCDTEDGFPELKSLSIFQLRNLESWQINGGMQKLEFLSFGHCPNLKNPPQGLENLPILQLVKVAGMGEDFDKMMERIGKDANDRFKVRPIPLFKHDFGVTDQKHWTRDEEIKEAAGSKGSLRTTSLEIHDTSSFKK
ncbi:disease resistance protein RPM1-like [Macadamia integrifolia]|uniref:disease resistance protein RPM1-like n=1 Tax=Macadamia integrifolia TaxID=60698 RepID=UPI001C4FFAEB|nr:disease resistance protein RPM1-like [Macadamia integrifolia]